MRILAFLFNFYGTAVTGGKKIIRQNGGNFFFGVSTRHQGQAGKDGIIEIPGAWVDIDFKETPQDKADESIKQLPIPPSAIIASGGGYHLYWFFREPAGSREVAEVEDINRRLVHQLGGDPASTDASRILRVPDTFNYKYNPPRRVKVLELKGRAYNLCDFDILAPAPDAPASAPRQRTKNLALDHIMSCRFMQHTRDDAASLPEPEWYAMLTELAREQGGPDLIHNLSRPHPDYKSQETDKKILHAINAAGPTTCTKIKSLWNCGQDCGVKAPAALAHCEAIDVNDAHDVSDVSGESDPNRRQLTQTDAVVTPGTSTTEAMTPAIMVDEFLETWPHLAFHVNDLYNHYNIKKSTIKKAINRVLYRRVKQDKIEGISSRSGQYRIVEDELNVIDVLSCEKSQDNLILPFNLHQLVKLQPGNIIVIAGEMNAGKTAFALNILYKNYKSTRNTRYITSEMAGQELRERLEAFDPQLENLAPYVKAGKVQFIEATDEFHRKIAPDAINIIDYLEVTEDFWMVGSHIRKIHDVIVGQSGICVVCIQKNPGKNIGLGGYRGLEKPRLYLNIYAEPPKGARLEIRKAKNWATSENPNGKEICFKLVSGAELIEASYWPRPQTEST